MSESDYRPCEIPCGVESAAGSFAYACVHDKFGEDVTLTIVGGKVHAITRITDETREREFPFDKEFFIKNGAGMPGWWKLCEVVD